MLSLSFLSLSLLPPCFQAISRLRSSAGLLWARSASAAAGASTKTPTEEKSEASERASEKEKRRASSLVAWRRRERRERGRGLREREEVVNEFDATTAPDDELAIRVAGRIRFPRSRVFPPRSKRPPCFTHVTEGVEGYDRVQGQNVAHGSRVGTPARCDCGGKSLGTAGPTKKKLAKDTLVGEKKVQGQVFFFFFLSLQKKNQIIQRAKPPPPPPPHPSPTTAQQ